MRWATARDGVFIGGDASNNRIGGTGAGAGNVIAHSVGAGVAIFSGTGTGAPQSHLRERGARDRPGFQRRDLQRPGRSRHRPERLAELPGDDHRPAYSAGCTSSARSTPAPTRPCGSSSSSARPRTRADLARGRDSSALSPCRRRRSTPRRLSAWSCRRSEWRPARSSRPRRRTRLGNTSEFSQAVAVT